MSFPGRYWFLLAGLVTCMGAFAEPEGDYESQKWQEVDVQLPVPPSDSTLQAFYVSAASENQFLIDLATLSVGVDGVVRYVLLVTTPEGGRNVTFEGMRCETRAYRVYASGRRDGAWSKARSASWSRIRDVSVNRQHAALFLDYFCPDGIIVRDAAEAVGALRNGGHRDRVREFFLGG